MIKSLFYKEWLKTRYTIICCAFIIIASCIYLHLSIKHSISKNGVEQYWFSLLYFRFIYFNDLKYIPAFIGIVLAISQYMPEIINKKIKLTLHLPANENKLLMTMHLWGTIALSFLFSLFYVLFIITNNALLPVNITFAAIENLSLWFLSSYTTYYLSSIIILENNWRYRILFICISAILFSLFYNNNSLGIHNFYILKISFIPIISILTIIYPITRFRKGDI